jgi:hypothetical protein
VQKQVRVHLSYNFSQKSSDEKESKSKKLFEPWRTYSANREDHEKPSVILRSPSFKIPSEENKNGRYLQF